MEGTVYMLNNNILTMEMNVKKRVIEVLKYKGLNVNRASKVLDMPQRTLNRQVNEDGNISMDLVYAILNNFPEISAAWLIAGEGEMVPEKENVVLDGAPFYCDLPVSAGYRDAFDPARERPSAFISLPMKIADFYFPVSGNSMEPEINDGDIVALVTNIDGLDVSHIGFAFWQDGKLHLLHASSGEGKVIRDHTTLFSYQMGKSRQTGIRVIRIKD